MIPLKSAVAYRRVPVVTWALIGVNALIFLFETSLPPDALRAFLFEYALVPARYAHPEWAQSVGLSPTNPFPFLSNIFLHGGWLHLIANMWTLYIFAPALEDRMGAARFLLFYLICGAGAGLAHAVVYADTAVPALGASGAIAGVLGAFMRLFPLARVVVLVPIIVIPYFFEVPAFLFALIWFGLQLLQGLGDLMAPAGGVEIAWWAHIGGFVLGAGLLRVFYRGPAYPRRRRGTGIPLVPRHRRR